MHPGVFLQQKSNDTKCKLAYGTERFTLNCQFFSRETEQQKEPTAISTQNFQKTGRFPLCSHIYKCKSIQPRQWLKEKSLQNFCLDNRYCFKIYATCKTLLQILYLKSNREGQWFQVRWLKHMPLILSPECHSNTWTEYVKQLFEGSEKYMMMAEWGRSAKLKIPPNHWWGFSVFSSKMPQTGLKATRHLEVITRMQTEEATLQILLRSTLRSRKGDS